MDTHNQHGCLSFYTQVQHTVAYGPRYGRPQTVIIKSSVVISLWGFRAKQWIIQSNISPSPQHTHTHTHTHHHHHCYQHVHTSRSGGSGENFPCWHFVFLAQYWLQREGSRRIVGDIPHYLGDICRTVYVRKRLGRGRERCRKGWNGWMDGWIDGRIKKESWAK